MILGIAGVLYGIAQAIGFAGTFATLWIQHGGGPSDNEVVAVYSFFGSGILSGLMSSFMSLFVLAGGFQMKRLRAKPLVIAASVLAMTPCISTCCLAGLPIGIWALASVMSSGVSEGFALQSAATVDATL